MPDSGDLEPIPAALVALLSKVAKRLEGQTYFTHEHSAIVDVISADETVDAIASRIAVAQMAAGAAWKRPTPPEAVEIGEELLTGENNEFASTTLWAFHFPEDLPETPFSGKLNHFSRIEEATGTKLSPEHAGRWLRLAASLVRLGGAHMVMAVFGNVPEHKKLFSHYQDRLPLNKDGTVIDSPVFWLELPPLQVPPKTGDLSLGRGDYLDQARELRKLFERTTARTEEAHRALRAFEMSVERRISESEARYIIDTAKDEAWKGPRRRGGRRF